MDEKVKKNGSKIDGRNLGSSFELEPNKGKKKKHKERKKKHGTDEILNLSEALEENCTGEAAERQTCSIEENITFMSNRKEERKDCDDSLAGMHEMGASKPSKKGRMTRDNEFKINEGEDDDQGKKMMKKKISGKRKSKESNDFKSNEGYPPLSRFESGDANERCVATEVNDQGKKTKVKKKSKASTSESPNPALGGTSKPKKVTFSDQVEVFFFVVENQVEVCCDDLVRGKRFTPEEDEKIKEAVFSYIESHGLGYEGLYMILNCISHPKVRDCWKEITSALPNRPHQSVYSRALILFERDEKRKWTPEELEFIRKIHEKHGFDWKLAAEALGKSRFHVKDAWRRIKLTDTNTGHWSPEEYQNLFDLVNLDIHVRALEGYRQSNQGMLRDSVNWEAIASKLATKTSAECCNKWYEQLTSPLVADGIWSDTDDHCLLNALFTLDACCFEEVEWDNLLEHRSGDVCRKRWNQMVRYIGEHERKSFAEQVEILAKRFCPDV